MGMKVNGTSGLTFPDTTTLASAGQASVRAWVNFNGTGTVAIRASYNVTSITDNGTGDYTVNFTTAMPDANYSVSYGCSMRDRGTYNDEIEFVNGETMSTTQMRFWANNNGSSIDPNVVVLNFFR
jgi:hypothetical protein